jgi:anoctamin-10
LTNWENHAHQSSYTASLTLKTFALSAVVAYLGLGLSAFVYVPFGEGVMRWVQAWLFGAATTHHGFKKTLFNVLNGTVPTVGKGSAIVAETLTGQATENVAAEGLTQLWNNNPTTLQTKLNPGRLKDQMFAYTVTNQIVNTFIEVGLPFVLRSVNNFRQKKAAQSVKESIITNTNDQPEDVSRHSSSSSVGSATGAPPKKRVVFEDEKERGGMAERAFLDSVRAEAAVPAYDLFVDYSEMVVQFGYVVLWSTIWPLAGGEFSHVSFEIILIEYTQPWLSSTIFSSYAQTHSK